MGNARFTQAETTHFDDNKLGQSHQLSLTPEFQDPSAAAPEPQDQGPPAPPPQEPEPPQPSTADVVDDTPAVDDVDDEAPEPAVVDDDDVDGEQVEVITEPVDDGESSYHNRSGRTL